MIKLSKEQIIMMHSQLIEQTGGIDGIRDEGLMELDFGTSTIERKAVHTYYTKV